VRDWAAALRELRRLLTPEGLVVFSTHHPAMDWMLSSPDDYFAVKQVTETWVKGGRSFEVSFWRRPLTDMSDAIADAGFVIERLAEPEPLAELAERDADEYETIRTKPRFRFFRPRPALERRRTCYAWPRNADVSRGIGA
jgi:SAM-dependent methyltransferase